ncbi:SH3 domain-containing protein [Clostridium minihomine]|uniref:SH3 domain-containing protein n=1 Tax=Clostridium minihomine TaxID=2045012 RepID=UPI000C78D9C6|nr:SH3 domain-containing protein [Clostridium minihomine]
MKKFYSVVMAAVMVVGSVIFPGTAYASSSSSSDQAQKGVPTADNVSMEMLNAQYWINRTKDANKTVMSWQQIQSFNQSMKTSLANTPGAMYDLSQYQDTIAGEDLKTLIREGASVPSGIWYVNGERVDASYWNALQDKTYLSDIQSIHSVRFGIMTQRSDIRSYPTSDVVTDDASDVCFDILQETAVLYNEPVVVLHQTQNQMWYYIVMAHYRGWVPAKDVALFETKAQWEQARIHKDFLVVTGNKIQLEPDPYSPALSELELSMGVVVDLAQPNEYPASIGDRVPMQNYVIKLPVRQEDGMVQYEYAMLPLNRDVSRGYLPYTRANVLTQSFKMLGDRYGWGGMLNSRDCSALTYEVYRCFGFQLPRNSSTQALIPCKTYEFSGKTTAQRKQILDQLKPGSILCQPGHITLYLGSVNGRYYVINDTGGFASVTGAVESARIRTVVVNELGVRRANGTTWLDSLLQAKEIGTPK